MPNLLLQMNSLADLAALDHSSAAHFLLARSRAAHPFAVAPFSELRSSRNGIRAITLVAF